MKDDAKYYALKKVPNLKNIDGIIVQATFVKKSAEFPDVFPPPLKWFLFDRLIHIFFDMVFIIWIKGVFDKLDLNKNQEGFVIIIEYFLFKWWFLGDR